MDWQERLRAEAIRSAHPEFDLLYHVSLRPGFPPDYDVPGLVAITFRLRPRPQGGHTSGDPAIAASPPGPSGPGWVYVMALDPSAALRIGARLGLEEGESLAMVDSHERMHIELQLAGTSEEDEEEKSRFVDAVWLSLRHPVAAEIVLAGDFGLVSQVGPDFWERLVSHSRE